MAGSGGVHHRVVDRAPGGGCGEGQHGAARLGVPVRAVALVDRPPDHRRYGDRPEPARRSRRSGSGRSGRSRSASTTDPRAPDAPQAAHLAQRHRRRRPRAGAARRRDERLHVHAKSRHRPGRVAGGEGHVGGARAHRSRRVLGPRAVDHHGRDRGASDRPLAVGCDRARGPGVAHRGARPHGARPR